MERTSMTATIPIPFAIGETLWWIGNGHREEWITCPECAGTKVLTLVKGSGEIIELNCNYCAPGMEPPRGVVIQRTYLCEPEPFTPQRVEIYGVRITYSESSPEAIAFSTVDAADLFRDIDECRTACTIKNEEKRANDERQAIAHLRSKRANLEHSSHYWSHKVRDLKRDLEIALRFVREIKAAKP